MNIAILGATGVVGRKMIEVLEERKNLNIENIYLFASESSAGLKIQFKDKIVIVETLNEENLLNKDIDVALIATGNKISEKYSPVLVKNKTYVIDNSSRFRLTEGIPLVIPEINSDVISNSNENFLIANPNCSTIQLLMSIYPIYKKFGLKQLIVATYQSISGKGKDALNEYEQQIKDYVNGKELISEVFNFPIFGNLIPFIDIYMEEENFKGYSKEEFKVLKETEKILNDNSFIIDVTAVRVPIKFCHSEAIFIQTDKSCTLEEIIKAYDNFPGVKLLNDSKNNLYPMPYYLVDSDLVYIGRIRKHPYNENYFSLWSVSDNLRKGAATNAIQILEVLVEKGLIKN